MDWLSSVLPDFIAAVVVAELSVSAMTFKDCLWGRASYAFTPHGGVKRTYARVKVLSILLGIALYRLAIICLSSYNEWGQGWALLSNTADR